jgi:hypothetical protein
MFLLVAAPHVSGCSPDDLVFSGGSGATAGMGGAGAGFGGSAGSEGGSGSGGSGGAGGVGGPGGSGGVGGPGGSGGAGVSQAVYYWGDYVTNNIAEVGLADGAVPNTLALQGFDLGARSIESVALSPDRTKIAVSGSEAPGAYKIEVYDADGSGAPTLIAVGNGPCTQLEWSPDGTRIAYISNGVGADGNWRSYVSPTDGSNTTPKLVGHDPPFADGRDTLFIVWVDNTYLAYVGDYVFGHVWMIWSVDVTAAFPPTPTALYSSQGGVEVSDVAPPHVDSMGRVYYIWGVHGFNSDLHIYRADGDDGANVEVVPGTQILTGVGSGTTEAFGMSADGSHLAFSVETDADQHNVYVLDVTTATATQVTFFAGPGQGGERGPDREHPIVWSPDETLLAVIGDWGSALDGEEVGDNNPFIIDIGAATATRVMKLDNLTCSYCRGARDLAFSADSGRVYVRGSMVEAPSADALHTELYTTDDFVTANQNPNNLELLEVPAADRSVIGLAPVH